MKMKKAVPPSYPNMREKLRCEDIGFEHLWEKIDPYFMYATYPPTYPPETRQCANCGRIEREVIVQNEIKKWEEV